MVINRQKYRLNLGSVYLLPLHQNLIPLLLFRPLRLILASGQIRSARIVLLKLTHWPYIAIICLYEGLTAMNDRWQSKSPHNRGCIGGKHRSTQRTSQHRHQLACRSGAPGAKPVGSDDRKRSFSTLEQTADAVVGQAVEIARLSKMCEQLMTQIEIDKKAVRSEIQGSTRTHVDVSLQLRDTLSRLLDRLEATPKRPR